MKKYVLLFLFSMLAVSLAHEGESVVAGSYKIELSTPEEVMVESDSFLAVSLEDSLSGERKPGIWFMANLSLNGTAFLSGSFVTNETGSSMVSYRFQKPGHYALNVTPELSNETATFHVRVLEEYSPPSSSVPLYMAASAAIFFAIGLAVGFIFSRRLGK